MYHFFGFETTKFSLEISIAKLISDTVCIMQLTAFAYFFYFFNILHSKKLLAYFIIVETHILKFLLKNSTSRPQMRPFVTKLSILGLICPRSLTMQYNIYLGHSHIELPLFRTFFIIFFIFFDSKFNNQFFNISFLSLALQVIFEIIPYMRYILYNIHNLESFTQNHSIEMNLIQHHSEFMYLTLLVLESTILSKLTINFLALISSILYFLSKNSHNYLFNFIVVYTLYSELVKLFMT